MYAPLNVRNASSWCCLNILLRRYGPNRRSCCSLTPLSKASDLAASFFDLVVGATSDSSGAGKLVVGVGNRADSLISPNL